MGLDISIAIITGSDSYINIVITIRLETMY